MLMLAASFLAACSDFRAATPSGFVELKDSEPYDYRAATAEGLVIAVRAIEHDPKGEIEFWASAIERRMREGNGYALLESRDVKTAQGLTGKQLRFGYDEGQAPHLYTITIFVTDSKLYLLEAGGKKELMEKRDEQLAWAVKHFQAD